MLTTLLTELPIAVAQAVILAALKRFLPILANVPPLPDMDPRTARIEQNRFFVASVVMYFATTVGLVLLFAFLPLVRESISGAPNDNWFETANFTSLQSAKVIGPWLPDVAIPGNMFSSVTWRAAMVALIPLMFVSGLIFWPLWRFARALGYDGPEERRRLHDNAAAASMFLSMWMLLFLFLPVGWVGAAFTLLVLVIVAAAISKLMG